MQYPPNSLPRLSKTISPAEVFRHYYMDNRLDSSSTEIIVSWEPARPHGLSYSPSGYNYYGSSFYIHRVSSIQLCRQKCQAGHEYVPAIHMLFVMAWEIQRTGYLITSRGGIFRSRMDDLDDVGTWGTAFLGQDGDVEELQRGVIFCCDIVSRIIYGCAWYVTYYPYKPQVHDIPRYAIDISNVTWLDEFWACNVYG